MIGEKRETTPEEKLFRVIINDHPELYSRLGLVPGSVGARLPRPGEITGGETPPLSDKNPSAVPPPNDPDAFWREIHETVRSEVNRNFVLVAVCLLCGLFGFLAPSGARGEWSMAKSGVSGFGSFSAGIFAGAVTPETNSLELPTLPPTAASPRLEKIAKPATLKLVGVSWNENGYVAMIEVLNKGIQIVRKGDMILPNVRVEEVSEFVVMLSEGSKKWVLN